MKRDPTRYQIFTDRALARPKGQAGADILWSELKYSANKRRKEFSLTKDDIFELCSKNCFYCNAVPYQISEVNNHRWGREITRLHGRFIYNSLDRINNDLGYIKENVVPCCPICNFAKRTLTKEQFYLWIKRLYDNLIKKGEINDEQQPAKESSGVDDSGYLSDC